MLFVAIVILVSLILYVRFFVLNSLRNGLQRRQTFDAAIKAAWFLPVFQQALFMFCLSLIYFYTNCKGFFFLLDGLIFFRQSAELELRFLVFASFIGGSGLLLCLNFMLAKISMNSKINILSLMNKLAYFLCSAIALRIIYMNLPLLNPNDGSFAGMVFYDDSYIIISVALIFLTVLVIPFFYTGNNKNLHYLQLCVRVCITYFVLCFILSALIFAVYGILKLTGL